MSGCERWVIVGLLLAVVGVSWELAPLEPGPGPAQPPTYADVLFVRAVETAPQTWTFYVTVAHPDEGWEHYADGWDVLLPDGTPLKPRPEAPFTRPLAHPHVQEQPFTRSQSGLHIPAEFHQVRVRAHDSLHGWGGREVVVDLRASAGEGFQVQRLGGAR